MPLRRMVLTHSTEWNVLGPGPRRISDQPRDPGLCKESAQICMFLTLRDMEDVDTAQGLTQLFGPYSPSALCDLDPTLSS